VCEDGACFLPGSEGCGAACVDVVEVEVELEVEVVLEVEVEVEVEVEEVEVGDGLGGELDVELTLELLDVVLLLVVDVVTLGSALVVVDDVEDVEGHEIDTTVAPGGSGTGLDAVGMLTVVSVPDGRRTVAMQPSATATGISAIACTPSTVSTVASAIVSFRLFNTLACILPPSDVGSFRAPRPRCGARGKLLAGVPLFNAQPSFVMEVVVDT
jgi:hypothetical protein